MSEMATPQLADEDVCNVLSAWTGFPSGRLRYRGPGPAFFDILREQARSEIFGQDAALDASVRGLARRSRLVRPAADRRPLWTALFVGPSGVGKTASAQRIGSSYFGEGAVRVINCSELTQEHHASRLTGAPPGYAGYGRVGQLVAALEGHGSGLLLFDEADKAHPATWRSVLLPLLEEGVVHDMSSGRALYAREWAVLLTANPACEAPATRSMSALRLAEEHFPHEVLGRIDDIIVFELLGQAAVRGVWEREEAKLRGHFEALEETVHLEIEEGAREELLRRIEPAVQRQGARAVMRLFRQTIAEHCLALLEGIETGPANVRVEGEAGGLRYRLVLLGAAG